MEKEDPAIVTKYLANDFDDFIAKLGADQSNVSITNTTESSAANAKPASFMKIVQDKPIKKAVKITELRNREVVEGAAVAIPIEAVEEVSYRFVNMLYVYFIGKRLAFPLVKNYVKNTWAKYGLKRIQLHEDFFLFQFDSKEGMERVMEHGPWVIRFVPLMLNVWTPNTNLKKDEIRKALIWVKLHHVPIVAYSEVGLSLITTQIGRPIMLDSYTSNMCLSSWGRNTYARAMIEVSADVKLKESIVIAIPINNEKGHTLATVDIEYEWTLPRCSTCLVFDHVDDKCPKLPKIEGLKLTKPALNLQYRKVEKGESFKASEQGGNTKKNDRGQNHKPNVGSTNDVRLTNSFSSLGMVTDDETDWGMKPKGDDKVINESDSKEVEELILKGPNITSTTITGASTPAVEDCTSNGSSCSKGTRIILGWNHNEVDVAVINQDDQYAPNDELYGSACAFIKYMFYLLGDFNSALFLEDSTFTWSQKPKGKDGLLKKIDRIMANMEFNNVFVGAHAIFKPYRVSDHSPSVLNIPTLAKQTSRPFKFYNVVTRNDRFKDVV
ncbi:reverse transcriptase domain, reverse transcriptase zinc-binding domain protein [Tanacetum coccineum]